MSNRGTTYQNLDAFQIKCARRSQKLTKKEVAASLAVSERDYTDAEEGRRPFSKGELIKIANLLADGLSAFEASRVDDMKEDSFELSALIASYQRIRDPAVKRLVLVHLDAVSRWDSSSRE